MSDHRRHRPPGLLGPLLLGGVPPMLGITAMTAAGWSGTGPAIAAVFQVAVYGLIGFAALSQRDANWRRRSGQIPTFHNVVCPHCAAWHADGRAPASDPAPALGARRGPART